MGSESVTSFGRSSTVCSKHRTRNVGTQSRAWGWGCAPGTGRGQRAALPCRLPAQAPTPSDFLRPLSAPWSAWGTSSAPWRGVLAWRLEGRIFWNLHLDAPTSCTTRFRGQRVALHSVLVRVFLFPVSRARSPHQTKQAQAKENLRGSQMALVTPGPALPLQVGEGAPAALAAAGGVAQQGRPCAGV